MEKDESPENAFDVPVFGWACSLDSRCPAVFVTDDQTASASALDEHMFFHQRLTDREKVEQSGSSPAV